jgi:hypothetical protein
MRSLSWVVQSNLIETITTFCDADFFVIAKTLRSTRCIQFRCWITERLREYLVKGFTLVDEWLKKPEAAKFKQ